MKTLLERMAQEIETRPEMCEAFLTDFTEHDTRSIESMECNRALWAIRPTGTWLILLDKPEPGRDGSESWVSMIQSTFHDGPHQWFLVSKLCGLVTPIDFERASTLAAAADGGALR